MAGPTKVRPPAQGARTWFLSARCRDPVRRERFRVSHGEKGLIGMQTASATGATFEDLPGMPHHLMQD